MEQRDESEQRALAASREPGADRTPFCVTDSNSANWVVRKIVEARLYRQRVARWAERETRKAQQRELFLMSTFGPQLQAWAAEQIKRRGRKQRSINLPAGRVGFRQQPGKLIVEDEQSAIEWAREHYPLAIVRTERLSKRLFKSHLLNSGELPDGVRLDDAHDEFYVS